ncbi:MAG: hypothetical protein GX930_04745, partial [Clostridia bacterium]|nr:hypothetical protein [Clostridia bacterium]
QDALIVGHVGSGIMYTVLPGKMESLSNLKKAVAQHKSSFAWSNHVLIAGGGIDPEDLEVDAKEFIHRRLKDTLDSEHIFGSDRVVGGMLI